MSRKSRIKELKCVESEALQAAAQALGGEGTTGTTLEPLVGNVNLLAAGTQLAQFSITPKITGKFRINFMQGVTNTEAVAHTGQVVITASNVPAGGAETFTYNSVQAFLNASIGAGQQIAGTCLTSGAGAFPLGTQVTFTFIAKGDVDNKVQAVQQTGQYIVTEIE